MRSRLCLAAMLLIGAPGWAAPGPARPLLGLTTNIPEGGAAEDIGREVTSARAMGVRFMYLGGKWSDLEPKPGEFDLKVLDGVPVLTALGFTVAITIQTLDTNNRTLPADLQAKPFGAPEMRERFDALLRAIAPKLTGAVKWVMLANEADIYLGEHPGEMEAFARLMEHGRRTLRGLKPNVAVGVTTTHDGVRDRPHIARRLNREMDVVTLTYYPLGGDFAVRPASDVPADFARMAQAAGDKPLLIQESGYPADPLLGSSEEKQAAFVDAVFDAMQKHAAKLAAVSFFLLYDFDSKLLETLVGYYRVPVPGFRAFLATLGLKRADGTPRKAWERFTTRAKAWSEPR